MRIETWKDGQLIDVRNVPDPPKSELELRLEAIEKRLDTLEAKP
jgi:hypothetical protein